MNDIEVVKGYRFAVREINTLKQQLDAAADGSMPDAPYLADLRAILNQRRAELNHMILRFEAILADVHDPCIRLILREYYALGHSDEKAAETVGMSTRRCNELRNRFLREREAAAQTRAAIAARKKEECHAQSPA